MPRNGDVSKLSIARIPMLELSHHPIRVVSKSHDCADRCAHADHDSSMTSRPLFVPNFSTRSDQPGHWSVRLRIGLAACLLGTAGMLFAFTRSVLSRPVCTPLLTLAAAYDPLWDLNGWVAEDVGRMESLDAETLVVAKLGEIDRLASGWWDESDALLKRQLSTCPMHQPLVLYVNLHGLVNDQGEPCLIPPKASPTDDSSWLPIASLLQHIEDAQPSEPRSVVMVLECGKIRSSHLAGIARNEFDHALRDLVDRHEQKHAWPLTVLSSASVGQRSIAITSNSPARGNLFTRFVAEALSGQADGFGETNAADGWVDSDELHAFVKSQTGRWAMRGRAVEQTPTLYRSGPSQPQRICCASRRPSSKGLDHRADKVTEGLGKRLQAADALIASLRSQHAERETPVLWAKLVRQRDALAAASRQGEAARRSQPRWLRHLESDIAEISRQIEKIRSADERAIDRHIDTQRLLAWKTLKDSANLETAIRFTDRSDAPTGTPEKRGDSSTKFQSPLLVAFTAQPQLEFWSRPEWLARLATAQCQWLETSHEVPHELQAAHAHHRQAVSQRRRELADTVLSHSKTDPAASADASRVETALQRFEQQVHDSVTQLGHIAGAFRSYQKSCSQLPLRCRWADACEAIRGASRLNSESKKANAGQADLAATPLAFAAVETCQHLERLLRREDIATNAEMAGQLRDTADRLERLLDQLATEHSTALSTAMKDHASDPARAAGWLDATLTHAGASVPHADLIEAGRLLSELDRSIAKQLTQQGLPSGEVQEPARDSETRSASMRSTCRYQHYLLQGLEATDLNPDPSGHDLRSLLASLSGEDGAVGWPNKRWQFVRASSLLVEDRTPSTSGYRNHDWQQRMASVAEITMDDFWREPLIDGVSQFAATSAHLIAAADDMAQPSANWDEQHKDLLTALHRRELAANGGLTVAGRAMPTADDPEARQIDLQIKPNQGTSFPPGFASLQVPTLGDPSYRVALRQFPIRSAHDRSVELPATADSERLGELQIRFRGHAFPLSVDRNGFAMHRTVARPRASPNTKLTVRAATHTRRAIAFVLDCSASMVEAAPREVTHVAPASISPSKPNGTVLGPTRLDAARGSIVALLDRLRGRNVDIGVLFYGHRVATNAAGTEVMIQEDYFKQFPFPTTLRPYADVEVALPMGRFGDQELSLVRQRLAALVPFGQTPLHLAIDRAIDDIGRPGADVSKDIVVISDGKNYQFNPTPDAIVKVDDLIQRARQQGIRVHLIGFGIADRQRQAAENEFRSIAEGTGGESTVDVQHAGELLQQLHKLATTSTAIEVAIADGEPVTMHLGQTIELPGIDRPNQPVSVSIDGRATSFPVSPGMHMKLTADVATGSTRVDDYDQNAPIYSTLRTASGRVAAARIGLHHQRSASDSPHERPIRLSLQRQDGLAVDRPAMMWAEVRPHADPISDSEQPITYQATDFHWLDDVTCPVAEFVCHHWPDRAVDMTINAWCSPRPPKPIATLPMEANRSTRHKMEGDWSESTIAVSDRQGRLRVVVQHAPSKRQVDRRCIVRLLGVTAAERSHWYSPDGLTSIHEFTRLDHRTGKGDASIEVTSLSEFKATAVYNATPLRNTDPVRSTTLTAGTQPLRR